MALISCAMAALVGAWTPRAGAIARTGAITARRTRLGANGSVFASSAGGGRNAHGTTSSDAPAQEFAAALAFDLETTGLDVSACEIVQFAVIVVNSRRGAKYSAYVLPEGPIDPGAASVHGLSREVLVELGARPFAAVWAECEAWLNETVQSQTRPLIWGAHNGDRFDRPILVRSVTSAVGGSALLSSPRAKWVDTLSLARRALPGRYRAASSGKPGPYTLGQLYKEASGGKALDGAHDALADTEALGVVWQWLVSTQGADPESTHGWEELGDLQGVCPRFQQHLQSRGYPQLAHEPPPSVEPATTQRGKSKKAPLRGKGRVEGDMDGLLRVRGIGPHLAQRLQSLGIRSLDDLRHEWLVTCGGSKTRMHGYLQGRVPGVSKLTLGVAVRGMQEEFSVPSS